LEARLVISNAKLHEDLLREFCSHLEWLESI
jgi:hypothetical protein